MPDLTPETLAEPENLTPFIDRIARHQYEEVDSHFSMPDGLSWEAYKAEDPEAAEALYLRPTRRWVLKALPALVSRKALLDALAAEKAAREEAERVNGVADVKAARLRAEMAEARAVKAEQERKQVEAELRYELGDALTEKDKAEARVAALEAGIYALADEWDHADYAEVDQDFTEHPLGCAADELRRVAALSPTDPTKEGDEAPAAWELEAAQADAIHYRKVADAYLNDLKARERELADAYFTNTTNVWTDRHDDLRALTEKGAEHATVEEPPC